MWQLEPVGEPQMRVLVHHGPGATMMFSSCVAKHLMETRTSSSVLLVRVPLAMYAMYRDSSYPEILYLP